MKIIPVKAYILLLAVFLTFLACSNKESTGNQFTATFVDHDSNQTKTGLIYVKGSRYRMDLVENGDSIVVIVNQDSSLTSILAPEGRQYYTVPSMSPPSLMNDPFQSVRFTASKGSSRKVGTEIINGFECDKFIISRDNNDLLAEWIAIKLKFPIKIELLIAEDKYMTLEDIKMTHVNDDLFRIPDNYSLMTNPSAPIIKVPEWADKIPSGKFMKPPFEKEVSSGEIIRIKPEQGKSFKFRAIDVQSDSADIIDVPFKDGKPLAVLERYGNFARRGVKSSFRPESYAETDEIDIYVEKGGFRLEAKAIDAYEKTVDAGEEFNVPIVPGEDIIVRYVNASEDSSICVFSFMKKDLDVSVGPDEYREVKLSGRNSVKHNTYRNDTADEIIFKVSKGKMLIKVSQFDTIVW